MIKDPPPATLGCPGQHTTSIENTGKGKAKGSDTAAKQQALDKARKDADDENDVEETTIVAPTCPTGCTPAVDQDPDFDSSEPKYTPVMAGDKIKAYRCEVSRKRKVTYKCVSKG